MKRTTLGGMVIVAPFALLFLILIAYAISNAVASTMILEGSLSNQVTSADTASLNSNPSDQAALKINPSALTMEDSETTAFQVQGESVDSSVNASVVVMSIFNAVLGFLGVLAVLGMFVCVPLGIYLLATKGKAQKS
ncbi:TPA: hypothetical protein DEB00_00210 [Candidatus Uhrbacteria bacterium]|nr:hypothetical protein [Candidatus Uhrbacteria bacterium]